MALELKSAQFRREREGVWRELETLVARAERHGMGSLDGDSLARLPTLYRATLSGLSVARAISLDRNLLDYLEALCARAYLCVYGVRERPSALLAAFFAWRLPAAVRGAWRAIVLAFIVILAGVLAAWFLTASDPAYYDSFIAKGVQQGRSFDASTEALRASLGGGGKDVDELGAFAAYLFSHNAQIGILSFSLGFALGVPTLALIFTNGLMLGAFLALFASRGLLVELGGWLSIHGPTEFLALILSAAAGLKIAGAVLFAGREPRLVRLARDGRDAAVIMMGAVMLFLLAGLLEGLGRQLVVGMAARYLLGWSIFAAIVAYFCMAGRERRP
ncbi:stage II sporulation protein M [Reyranella soli]|uniref:Membrane protein n=1 Tax=Reyranella soli TaxID=1230389 RepID=A0A512NDL5_9HYPH|nr:stage II sporulation protein M [Reyranella soli]GEP57060.1 membrane protein [Reyranella soli]